MTTLIDRASTFLESRLSRRSLIVRSAFAGSALTVSGLDFALRPGSAYSAICTCGDPACGCGSTCCEGFSQFCCTINGGYNFCPDGTVVGGWWKADGSAYCNGPRYYMDCNATCQCDDGCGDGWPFCEPGCDGLSCGCALGDCNNWVTGCFQFRYGQCNQDVACMGRILCRVVSCVPPWEFDSSCTNANAEDDFTANMNVACNTSFPIPPPPPCGSPSTRCEVVGMARSPDGLGYVMVTAFGKVLNFGDDPFEGDASNLNLDAPMCGIASTPSGLGYWTVAGDGGVFCFGDAGFHGSMGGLPLDAPMCGMAATPSGLGYWTVAADGGVFCFGDAGFHGSMGGRPLNRPMVGMAATPSGLGYWTVAADGGVFCFGDAGFHGSAG